MSAGRICIRDVHLAEPHETIRTAAERMAVRGVGTLVVIDSDRRPIGIVTDRDLVLRVLAKRRDPDQATIADVMTGGVYTVTEDTPIEDTIRVMRGGPYRRVPVVDDDGRLVGIVSLDDVLSLLGEEMNRVTGILEGQSWTQRMRELPL